MVSGIALAAGAAVALAARWLTYHALRARIDHLEEAAQPQHRTSFTHQQRLHWELLSKAMDDPELAEVLDAYDGTASPRKVRQFLFANALYTNALCYYRMGNMAREEFFGFARSMLQNPVFREYWYASRPHRATLADSSEEARLGRMVDDLLAQLEEADTDEWWVVGELPGE
jgi:hypothetical protein